MPAPLRIARDTGNGRRAVAAFSTAVLTAPLLLSAAAPPAVATAPDPDREGRKLAAELVDRTTADNAMRHLEAFQAIADAHDGNRAAGTDGHALSAEYAGGLLEAAGYEVTYQEFVFTHRETVEEKLTLLTPEERDIPVKLMTYTESTPEGGVEAAVAEVPVDADGAAGCKAGDFAQGRYAGRIALIRRGGCTFAQKQANAADAGAVGAVIYNDVDGELSGTLGDTAQARIPTGGISKADGDALSAEVAKADVTANLELIEFQEDRSTPNVIAETRGGDPDNVVMLGAHLDSVAEGPGINDNGSGSAGILEAALQYAGTARLGHDKPSREDEHSEQPPNKVRFALWSAEEVGLKGSAHYVEELSEKERRQVALYLNFDMIASPNYGLFVYDGDGSDGESDPGPDGSAQLEYAISRFMTAQGHPHRGTAFNGRSDYGPFIDAGIPAGGTFTGAEGLKTEKQAELWGGKANAAYDANYHQAGDDITNVDPFALDTNIKVIANAVGTYAWDTSSLDEPVPGHDRPKDSTAGGKDSGSGPHYSSSYAHRS